MTDTQKEAIGGFIFWLFVATTTVLIHIFGLNK